MKAIVVILLSVLIAAVYSQQTDSYVTESTTIAPGNMSMGYFQNIPRPGGDIIITGLSFQIFNAATNITVSIEDVYNHHLGLFAILGGGNYSVIAGIGAEGERTPINFPKGYGVHVPANAPIWMDYDFINIWGLASNAEMTVYVGYNITWIPTTKSIKQLTYLLLDVTGFPNGNVTYSVPNSCPQTQGIYTKQLTFTWTYPTATIVYLIGHLHIGAALVTLQDSKGELICKADPTYDSMNFINSMGTCEPAGIQFVQGDAYTMSVEYYCKGYMQAMGMLQVWISSDTITQYAHALTRGQFELVTARPYASSDSFNFPVPKNLLHNLTNK